MEDEIHNFFLFENRLLTHLLRFIWFCFPPKKQSNYHAFFHGPGFSKSVSITAIEDFFVKGFILLRRWIGRHSPISRGMARVFTFNFVLKTKLFFQELFACVCVGVFFLIFRWISFCGSFLFFLNACTHINWVVPPPKMQSWQMKV